MFVKALISAYFVLCCMLIVCHCSTYIFVLSDVAVFDVPGLSLPFLSFPSFLSDGILMPLKDVIFTSFFCRDDTAEH